MLPQTLKGRNVDTYTHKRVAQNLMKLLSRLAFVISSRNDADILLNCCFYEKHFDKYVHMSNSVTVIELMSRRTLKVVHGESSLERGRWQRLHALGM